MRNGRIEVSEGSPPAEHKHAVDSQLLEGELLQFLTPHTFVPGQIPTLLPLEITVEADDVPHDEPSHGPASSSPLDSSDCSPAGSGSPLHASVELFGLGAKSQRAPLTSVSHVQTADAACARGMTRATAVAFAMIASLTSVSDASRIGDVPVPTHDPSFADKSARSHRPEEPHIEIQGGLKLIGLEPIVSITPTPSCPRMRPGATLGTSPFKI